MSARTWGLLWRSYAANSKTPNPKLQTANCKLQTARPSTTNPQLPNLTALIAGWSRVREASSAGEGRGRRDRARRQAGTCEDDGSCAFIQHTPAALFEPACGRQRRRDPDVIRGEVAGEIGTPWCVEKESEMA